MNSTLCRLVFVLALIFVSRTSYSHDLIDTPPLNDKVNFYVEEVASGLSIPWAITFISPTQLLITERPGTIKRLDLTDLSLTPIKGVARILAEGQGGLLDAVVPPTYAAGDWIYFTYSKDHQGQGVTTLARARLNGDRLESWQEMLVTRSGTNTSRHFGSRIAFDHQGHLFFTVGDRGDRPNGQDLSTHAGSVLRLKIDGSIPTDNPFIDHPKALPEIWSYGHRNPQGIAYDTETQRLWIIEHGPRGGDEINLVHKGLNYGWPVVSYGKEYWGPISVGEAREKAGMESPVKVYIPSIAPASLLLYSGKAFPQWKGDLFSGALKLRHLNRIKLSAEGKAIGEQRLLTKLSSRIRALAESPEGWIYLSTDSGRILRLRPRQTR
ncbi:MAG: PQQ-dependent sugar dehydrogenase [Motiliproteus sp.]|nr:PQQ-dependent sugar dehydrogenase [Motiliproteus sp.]MCW9053971.1 PQQ-dependent sugar dehydrogenase [Motiliproteus sp.]